MESIKIGTVIGFKCKICGATGHFDEFPKRISYNDHGKECETFCKNDNCDGWNEDLKEDIVWDNGSTELKTS